MNKYKKDGAGASNGTGGGGSSGSNGAPTSADASEALLRSFVAKPPPKYASLFQALHSESRNEVEAHLTIFSRNTSPDTYWSLVSFTAADLQKALRMQT